MRSTGWIFALVALAVLAAMHLFLWRRFARDTGLGPRVRRALALAMACGALAVAASFGFGRALGERWPSGIALGAWTWFGFAFYAVLLFGALAVASALGRGAHRLAGPPGKSAPGATDRSRRELLARAAAASVGFTAATVVGCGERSARSELDTPEIPLALPRLPRELHGLRIVQLTDLHLGPLLGAEHCERIVERIRELRPDLIAVTGDIVDAPVAALRAAAAPLARLQARYGVHFVTGNHEYYSGVDEWLLELRRMGMRVLMNERVAIGAGSASFDLAGVPDESAGRRAPGEAQDLARALAGRDPERALLVLAHRPTQAQQAVRAGAGAALCGHTHGGQMWPFGALVGLVQPYVEGLHREGDGLVYVSRGAGFWGPPVRVLAPPELPCFVLC